MNREDILYWLRVHLATGVGPKRFQMLLQTFGTPRNIVNASLSALRETPNLGRSTANRIYEGLQIVDSEAELAEAEKAGVTIIPIIDSTYPEFLRNCPDPPPILYVKGRLQDRDQLSLAVVGTRRPGLYGSEQAYRFSLLLAQTGFVIVSGLARGIDAQAHRAALLAKGRTLAVLGSGLNQIYPPEHHELADQIVQSGGAVISEFPMNTAPQAGNFPARNRIVAAITLGTLLVEAPAQSGALITAALAQEYNREVFAVPGPVDHPGFAGSHNFIKTGKAKLVTCLEDILDELGDVGRTLKPLASKKTTAPHNETKTQNTLPFDAPPQIATHVSPGDSLSDLLAASLSEPEKHIWDFLAHGANDIDTIIAMCRLTPNHASAAITTLQIKGLVKSLPGNQYARR
jgi:DNA processing protein